MESGSLYLCCGYLSITMISSSELTLSRKAEINVEYLSLYLQKCSGIIFLMEVQILFTTSHMMSDVPLVCCLMLERLELTEIHVTISIFTRIFKGMIKLFQKESSSGDLGW